MLILSKDKVDINEPIAKMYIGKDATEMNARLIENGKFYVNPALNTRLINVVKTLRMLPSITTLSAAKATGTNIESGLAKTSTPSKEHNPDEINR